MNSESLKDFILNELQKHDHDGLKGTKLSVHIPIQEKLLNIIAQTIVSTSEAMKDFDSLYFSEMGENEFLLYIDHKKFKKNIRCEIQGIEYNYYSDPILKIKFLEGIHFYEKVALKSATTFKKGWKWLKTKWQDENGSQEKAKPAVDISSSKLKINLSQLLKQQDLDYLTSLISWEDVSTHENTLVIDFSIKV